MLASHSSDSESSEPKQQPEMLSPLLKTSCMPVQQSEAGTDHAGRMLLFDKSSLRRTSWHPADFNCVLKSSLCRDLLDEKPYFCATALLLFLFMFFFFFSVNQLRSLLQKQSKDANVQSPSPSKRKLAGKVFWLLFIAYSRL